MIDKASLIQIPSGYKNGKLYSVKPNPSYGSELVTNGDFATDSDWTKQIGWSISDGVANYDFTSDAKYIRQTLLNSGFVSGKTYRINFEITEGTAYMYINSNGGGLISLNTYSVGSYSLFTTASVNGSDLLIYGRNTSGSSFSIDNVSVKEVLKDGDFDFSRSSSGTRVNSEGLIETAQVVSTTELVTNGDFATDSDWTKGSGWSISGGKATKSGTDLAYLTQSSLISVIGKTYRVKASITNVTTGNIRIDNFTSGTTYTSNIEIDITYTATSAGVFRFLGWGGFDGSIDNVSVKEVFENDVPRLDYSDGSCASLLLEGQRTNTMLHSELFTDSVYSRTSMSLESSPSGVSPDGTTNAFKVNPSVNGSSSFMFQSSTLTGSNMTQSIFIKSNSSTGRFVQLTGSSGVSNQNHVNFDLLNGTIYDSVGTFNAFIEDYGSGWYRIGITSNTSATAGRFIFAIVSSLSSSRLSGTGLTTDMEFYIYGYQLENGAFKTSYIPTSGSTVTRTADVCNNAGTSATFNSTEGVLFAEIAALADDSTGRRITISDGTTNNRMAIGFDNASNKIKYFLMSSNTTQVSQDISVDDITQFNKIAFLYKENDFKLYMNGSLIASDTSGSTFSANTLNVLKFAGYSGTSQNFYGKVKQLIVFNEALSDSELQALTTL